MDALLELERQIGIDISDYALLGVALTHRSFLNEHEDVTEDNERLEYLGDAVIDLIAAEYLFLRFGEMREGEMTALRAALVRAETLAKFAQQVGVDRALRLGLGESENGGRERVATLCAAFEAVVGAVYLDAGFEPTKRFIERLIAPELEQILAGQLHKDARSEFQVWAQATYNTTPRYEVIQVEGPDHERVFTVQVTVDEKIWGSGEGRSKQTAAHAAARAAMKQVRVEAGG